LFIDTTEFDTLWRTPRILRVDGHESVHEICGVHGSKIIALHVFAQLGLTILGKRNGFHAALNKSPWGRPWRCGNIHADFKGKQGKKAQLDVEVKELSPKDQKKSIEDMVNHKVQAALAKLKIPVASSSKVRLLTSATFSFTLTTPSATGSERAEQEEKYYYPLSQGPSPIRGT
jgi:hypothetical protein